MAGLRKGTTAMLACKRPISGVSAVVTNKTPILRELFSAPRESTTKGSFASVSAEVDTPVVLGAEHFVAIGKLAEMNLGSDSSSRAAPLRFVRISGLSRRDFAFQDSY
eukprot:c53528_g1_i1.p2 GENE.c53528_g1_i1~~c53528_g1_i1.p2  ORF type:complete len:108 (-),score=3.01 c53528_g1_i1:308-631(-)